MTWPRWIAAAAVLWFLAGVLAARGGDLQPVSVGYFNVPDFATAQDITDQTLEGVPYYLWIRVQWLDVYRKRTWHVEVYQDGELLHEFEVNNIQDNRPRPDGSRRVLMRAPVYLSGGPHTLTMAVDSRGEIRERSESNNNAERTFECVTYPHALLFDDPYDFNNDGEADLHVYDRLTSTWHSSDTNGNAIALQFGFEPTVQCVGDFDGDGVSDRCLFDRFSGMWYVAPSTSPSFSLPFGHAYCVPAPADFDGDGRTDFGLYDIMSATWHSLSLAGFSESRQLGTRGGIPVPRDYDGDGRADPAVFDPASGLWYVAMTHQGYGVYQRGRPGDMPVPAEYNGDGMCDMAVFQPDDGLWRIFMSTGPSEEYYFASGPSVPMPADYTGDGRADLAVYTVSGSWAIRINVGRELHTTFGWSGADAIGVRP